METISIKEAARRLDVPQKDITLLIETKELTEAEGGGNTGVCVLLLWTGA